MSHYRFTQSVDGVPIEGAIFIVHTNKQNEVTATTGQLYKDAAKKVTKTKSKIN